MFIFIGSYSRHPLQVLAPELKILKTGKSFLWSLCRFKYFKAQLLRAFRYCQGY
jgi:hypothetical protein